MSKTRQNASVLVTGGAGLIGSHIVDRLVDSGPGEIRVLDKLVRGHMAFLLSAIGPDPIVRLQTGGLRAAEWIFREREIVPEGVAQLVDLAE